MTMMGDFFNRRHRSSIYFGLALILFAPRIVALGLGEIHVTSKLGEHFSGRIPILFMPGESVDPSCFKLLNELPGQDGVPLVDSAKLTVNGGSGDPYLKISSRKRITDLAARLLIRVGCESEITREYTILLDLPDNAQTAQSGQIAVNAPLSEPVLSSPKPVLPASQRDLRSSGMEWAVTAGESLTGIAANIYPDSRRMQRKFIRHAIVSNPEVFSDKKPGAFLPVGTVLHFSDLREQAHPPVEKKSGQLSVAELTAQPPTKPDKLPASQKSTKTKKSGSGADVRLKLTTGDLDISASGKITEEEREMLREKQRILMDIDDMAAYNLSLNHRLKQMEGHIQELQSKLEGLDRQRSALQPGRSPPPILINGSPSQPSGIAAYTNIIAFSAGGLGLLIVALWGYFQRKRKRAEADALMEFDADLDTDWEANSETKDLGVPAPIVFANADVQPRRTAAPEYAPEIDKLPSSAEASKERYGFSDNGLEITLGSIESAIEEADIYLALGEKGRAIANLKYRIDSHPRSTADLWLKLLEIYHNCDMRAEFETLATGFHQYFNIAKLSWESMVASEDSSLSIEQFPHLVEKISSTWGSSACLEYLRHLLTDNRGGLRQGFELGMATEILLLVHVLEMMLGQSGVLSDGETFSEENRALEHGLSEETEEPYKASDNDLEIALGRIENATEEADIYLALGEKDRAIAHLKDRIDAQSGPDESLWLKLLGIYRDLDMRAEFKILATEFCRNFNTAKPDWEALAISEGSFHSIEQFPHLMERISATWGSPVCLNYLRHLLLDSEGRIRDGLALGMASDILLLIPVLEGVLGESVDLPIEEKAFDENRALEFTFELSGLAEPEKNALALPKPELDLLPALELDSLPVLEPYPPSIVDMVRDPDLPSIKLAPVQSSEPESAPMADSRSALESLHSRIAENITLTWGEPEALRYLENLVVDNRGGRAGFSEDAVSELMMLTLIARDYEDVNDIWTVSGENKLST